MVLLAAIEGGNVPSEASREMVFHGIRFVGRVVGYRHYVDHRVESVSRPEGACSHEPLEGYRSGSSSATQAWFRRTIPTRSKSWIRYLGLLASSLIYWNVVEISRAIGELVNQGYPVNKADLAYLSPYLTRHIKRFGDYTIHTELAPG